MRSVLNHGTNKNCIFDRNVEASVGERTAHLGDFFFSQNGRRVNASMTVLGSDNLVVASILASGLSRFASKLSPVR